MGRHRDYPAIPETGYPPECQHSPDEFVIPAKDEDGNFERQQFRCTPHLAAWMGEIVRSKKFPFQREGDLMRWCLYAGCVWLSRIEPAVPSMQARIDAAADAVRNEELEASVVTHLDKFSKLITKLEKQKAYGRISYLIDQERKRAAGSIDEDPYWGQYWIDQVEEKFAQIASFAEAKQEFMDYSNLMDDHNDRRNGNGSR